MQYNTVARSRNIYTSLDFEKPVRALLWQFNIASNSRNYSTLRIKHPICLPNFHQIWYCSANFYKISQHQISRKSFQWKSRWYMWTDGRTDGGREWRRTVREFSFYVPSPLCMYIYWKNGFLYVITQLVFICFIKLMTCFGLCFRPSSGHKIYVIMLEETTQCKS
jgi:hypothetical protein